MKKKEVIGKTINNFKVLEEIPNRHPSGQAVILCRGLCLICNQEDIREKGSVFKYPHFCTKKRFVGNMSGMKWGIIKHGAKRRGIEFTISREYLWSLYIKQSGKCAISGVDIDFAKNTKEFRDRVETASLDRIDSSKGYVEGNVQWVHKIVNSMKMTLSNDELIKWCNIIANRKA